MNNTCSILCLKNCNIYSPAPLKGKNSILIKNGKIVKVAKKVKAPKGALVIDCKGKIAVPGFIDVHAQGAGGRSLTDGTMDSMYIISRTFAKTGVTSFLATSLAVPGKEQKHLEVIGTAVKNGLPGAACLGIHLEGPFINPKKKGMIREDTIRSSSIKFMDFLIKVSKKTISMMTIAPELPGNLAMIKHLRKNRIIASIGHCYANYKEANLGFKAGITHATHFFNAMPVLHHREPGTIGAIFDSKRVTAQVIADGAHLNPVILRMIYKILGPERITLITDSMPSLGLPDGEYDYFSRDYKCVNGTCYYKDGTLIGTAVPLNELGKRMMDFTGASFEEIIRMLSTNAAKELGLKNKGVIRPGADADIVVTDRNFKIHKVIVNGREV